tara:strand:+ start:10341 stop:11252 length:912 start_codon:yes stop_codon:yes gene_type:complete
MNQIYQAPQEGTEGPPGDGGAAPAAPAGDAAVATATEPAVEPAAPATPSLENLQGENRRLTKELSDARTYQNNLRSLAANNQPTATSPAAAPDGPSPTVENMVAEVMGDKETFSERLLEDPATVLTSIFTAATNNAAAISDGKIQAQQQANETRSMANTRQAATDRNVESFKEGREWTQDADTWAGFENHMNTIYGAGPNNEITVQQLQQQEMAYRGNEMINEGVSDGAAQTIQAIQQNGTTRTPSGTAAGPESIVDMSIDDQMDTLAEFRGEEQQALFEKLSPERQKAILRRVDQDGMDENR